MESDKYIQYGCGWCAPIGWRNFDASPTLRFERIPLLGSLYTKNKARFPRNVEYGDIVKGLPVSASSCDAVYCSHVLEHLSLEELRIALRNTINMLRAGGTFRFVLPDLEQCVKSYLTDPSKEAAISFMRETCLGLERRPRSLKGLAVSWLGNSQHLWMWDYKGIELELVNAGFVQVRQASLGDSSDRKFTEVEEQSRWDKCLGVECKKSLDS